MARDTLLQTLCALESDLHRPDVRRDESRVGALLHPQFEEIGRSGRHWSRDATISQLANETDAVDVVADHYAVTELQPGVALLTYRTALRQVDGSLGRHTLRSSIWLQAGDLWQLRYHQGTPVSEGW